jgi:hypothetical protein
MISEIIFYGILKITLLRRVGRRASPFLFRVALRPDFWLPRLFESIETGTDAMDEEGDCPKVGEVDVDAVGNGDLGTLFFGSGNLVDGVFLGGGMSPPIPYLDCKVASAASKSFCGGFLSVIRGEVEVMVVDD